MIESQFVLKSSTLKGDSIQLNFQLDNCKFTDDYVVCFEDAESNEELMFLDFTGEKKFSITLNKNQLGFHGTIIYPIKKVGRRNNITLFCKIKPINDAQCTILGSNIEINKNKSLSNSIFVDPPFIQERNKVNISGDNLPDGNAIIEFGNKKFKSKINQGRLDFDIDTVVVLKDSDFHGQTVRKIPIKVKISNSEFNSEIGIVPKSLRSLQATNDPQRPECVIIDSRPSQDQSFRFEPISLDCFKEPLIGPLYQSDTKIFNKYLTSLDSNFKNCHQGFMSDSSTVFATEKILGQSFSTSADKTISDENFDFYTVVSSIVADTTVPSDVAATIPVINLVKHFSSTNFDLTAKFRGVIEKPYSYYHSISVEAADLIIGNKGSIVFRFPGGIEISKNITFASTDQLSVLSQIRSIIDSDSVLSSKGVITSIINIDSVLELTVQSNSEFTIYKGQVSPTSSDANKFDVVINSNRTLRLFVTECFDRSLLNNIKKVIFNTDPFKGAIVDVVSADDTYILLNFNPGVNKPNGFFVQNDIYCVEFFGVNSTARSQIPDNKIFNRILRRDGIYVPTINPVVSSNGRVFCQAEIDGKYQIFMDDHPNWVQLTFDGENRNPFVVGDKFGNLHLFFESNRTGESQVYYSAIGYGSFQYNDSALNSASEEISKSRTTEKYYTRTISDLSDTFNNESSFDVQKFPAGVFAIPSISLQKPETEIYILEEFSGGSPKNFIVNYPVIYPIVTGLPLSATVSLGKQVKTYTIVIVKGSDITTNRFDVDFSVVFNGKINIVAYDLDDVASGQSSLKMFTRSDFITYTQDGTGLSNPGVFIKVTNSEENRTGSVEVAGTIVPNGSDQTVFLIKVMLTEIDNESIAENGHLVASTNARGNLEQSNSSIVSLNPHRDFGAFRFPIYKDDNEFLFDGFYSNINLGFEFNFSIVKDYQSNGINSSSIKLFKIFSFSISWYFDQSSSGTDVTDFPFGVKYINKSIASSLKSATTQSQLSRDNRIKFDFDGRKKFLSGYSIGDYLKSFAVVINAPELTSGSVVESIVSFDEPIVDILFDRILIEAQEEDSFSSESIFAAYVRTLSGVVSITLTDDRKSIKILAKKADEPILFIVKTGDTESKNRFLYKTNNQITDLEEGFKNSFSIDSFGKSISNNNKLVFINSDFSFNGYIPAFGTLRFDDNLINPNSIGYYSKNNSGLASSISDSSGLYRLDDFNHSGSDTVYEINRNLHLESENSDLYEFVVFVIFESKSLAVRNEETFSEFCSRTSQEFSTCGGYIEGYVEKIYSGRYKIGVLTRSKSFPTLSKDFYPGGVETHIFDTIFNNNGNNRISIDVNFRKLILEEAEHLVKANSKEFFLNDRTVQVTSRHPKFIRTIKIFSDGDLAGSVCRFSTIDDKRRQFDAFFGSCLRAQDVGSKFGIQILDENVLIKTSNIRVGKNSYKNNSNISLDPRIYNFNSIQSSGFMETLSRNESFEFTTEDPGDFYNVTENLSSVDQWDSNISGFTHSGSYLDTHHGTKSIILQDNMDTLSYGVVLSDNIRYNSKTYSEIRNYQISSGYNGKISQNLGRTFTSDYTFLINAAVIGPSDFIKTYRTLALYNDGYMQFKNIYSKKNTFDFNNKELQFDTIRFTFSNSSAENYSLFNMSYPAKATIDSNPLHVIYIDSNHIVRYVESGNIATPFGYDTKVLMVATGEGFSVAIDFDYKLRGFIHDPSTADAAIIADIEYINSVYPSEDSFIKSEFICAGPDFFVSKSQNNSCSVYGNKHSDTLVPQSGLKLISFACGDDFIVGIKDNGELTAWGDNASIEASIPSGLFTKVACGNSHAIAIDIDGNVSSWGDNTNSQCNTPVGLKAVDIAAGNDFSFALTNKFYVLKWGNISFANNNNDMPDMACSIWAKNDTVIFGGFQNEWSVSTDQAIHQEINDAFLTYPIRFRSDNDIWAPGPVIDLFKLFDKTASDEEYLSRYCRVFGDTSDYCSSDFKINSSLLLSQIPVSTSNDSIGKNADICMFNEDKISVVYQSNRRSEKSDIIYKSPLNHFSRLSQTLNLSKYGLDNNSSFEPSIGCSYDGNSIVSWRAQDFSSSDKDTNHIYYSFVDSQNSIIDPCLIDEMIFKLKDFADVDPYDPYDIEAIHHTCEIEFEFTSIDSNSYHFFASFYTDKDLKEQIAYFDSNKDSSLWLVDGIVSYADGVYINSGETVNVRFLADRISELSNKVLFVKSGFKTESSSNISDIESLNGSFGYPLLTGNDLSGANSALASNSTIWISTEGLTKNNLISKQAFSDYRSDDNIIRFNFLDSDTLYINGVLKNELSQSFYIHVQHDPGNNDYFEFNILFNGIVSYVAFTEEDLLSTDPWSLPSPVVYPTSYHTVGSSLSSGEFIKIDQSGSGLAIKLRPKSNGLRALRIIVKESKSIIASTRSVFLCNKKDNSICDVELPFINKTNDSSLFKVRVDVYSDDEYTNYIGAFDSVNNSNCFSDGIMGYYQCPSRSSLYIHFTPPVMEYLSLASFDMSSNKILSQDGSYVISENMQRKYLQPEVIYYFKSYAVSDNGNNSFIIKSSFKCDMKEKADANYSNAKLLLSNKNHINNNLEICSLSKGESIISWTDTRLKVERSINQSFGAESFKTVFATADINDKFVNSSSNGGIDRMFKFISSGVDSGVEISPIYQFNIVSDDIGNFTAISKSNNSIFSSHLSLATKRVPKLFEVDTQITSNNQFIDQTSRFENAQNYEEFRRIRVVKDFVDYFSTINQDVAYPVVSDCFIQLDIIGVPGTQAVRIKNENDPDFSPWLHIQAVDSVYLNSRDEGTKNFIKEFSPYFVERERFIVPWVLSSSNGIKKVCVQVLTAFGVTNTFCIDIIVNYRKIDYTVDFYYIIESQSESSEDPEDPDIINASSYKNYPLLNNKTIFDSETSTYMKEGDLRSLNIDSTSPVSKIKAIVKFNDVNRVERIQDLLKFPFFASRSGNSVIGAKLYQQGIEIVDVPLTKTADGVYEGDFVVNQSDGIAYRDGLGAFVVNVPGECLIPNIFDLFSEFRQSLSTRLNTQVNIVNYANYILDFYNKDDLKNSFGSPSYYSNPFEVNKRLS